MNKLFNKIAVAFVGMAMAIGVVVAVGHGIKDIKPVYAKQTSTTYTFTSTAWADSTSSWDSNKAGSTTDASRGIGIQKAETGAGATTKTSFSNIVGVSINCSKSNKGVGSIAVKVGSTTVISVSSFETTATDVDSDDLDFLEGKVSFVVTCTTSTLYVKSITITCDDGSSMPDSISAKQSEYEVMVGETLDLTKCVTTTGSGELSFECETNSYVSISSTTLSANNEGGPVEITAHKGSEATTFNVTAIPAPVYRKVTSTLADYRGTYLLVNETESLAMDGSLTTTLSDAKNGIAVSISTGTITGSTEINKSTFEIGRYNNSGSKYYLKSNSGYYIGRTTSTNGFEMDTNTKYQITPAVGTITSSGGPKLQFWKAGDNWKFSFYASNQNAIALYKLDISTSPSKTSSLNGFVSSFATKTGSVCKTDNSTSVSDLNTQWTLLSGEFAALSVDAQAVLANTTYTHNGETKDSLQDIVDRYDWIIGHHSASLTSGEFMNRTEAATIASYARADIVSFGNIQSDSATIIIVVISLVSLTAIGGFFFIRKRKEN